MRTTSQLTSCWIFGRPRDYQAGHNEYIERSFLCTKLPEIVEAHLRADKNLTPETAKALSELFRVAYTQFSKPEDK